MQTDAVVLDSLDHGESDLILTLYCRSNGRMSAIAKGARKSKKRFVNKLEIFSFLNVSMTVSGNRSLAFLSAADLHTSFINIRNDYRLYGVASIIRETMLTTLRDGEADDRVFRLSLWALHSLDIRRDSEAILCLFLIRFYDLLGYRPELSICVSCKSAITDNRQYSFDTNLGGLRCSHCVPHHQHHNGILSRGTIRLLQSAQDIPLERLQRLKVTGVVLHQALQFLQRYGQQLFQRELISWRCLHHHFARRQK